MRFKIDFFVNDVIIGLGLLGRYQVTMEEQLQKAEVESRRQFDKMVAAIPAAQVDREDLDVWRDQHDHEFKDEFPRYLRYSFVVLLHSFVDRQLLAACDEITKRKKLPLRAKELKGSSIQQARMFLKKLAIELSEAEWQPLNVLAVVRDCVVHTGGDITKSRDKKALEQQGSKVPGFSIRPDNQIILEPEFFSRTIDFAMSFFRTLFKAGPFGPEKVVIESGR